MKKAILIAPLFVLASTVVKAQDIPPLAPLRGDAASLADTMKFIQEKLPGTVTFMQYAYGPGGDGTPNRYSHALTQVAADANRCNITFHTRLDINIGNTPMQSDREILLKQVQDISLGQQETAINLGWAKRGHPEETVKVQPPIALVVIKSAPGPGWVFYFYDDSLAERVSRALQHAVSLCGGGKPETF